MTTNQTALPVLVTVSPLTLHVLAWTLRSETIDLDKLIEDAWENEEDFVVDFKTSLQSELECIISDEVSQSVYEFEWLLDPSDDAQLFNGDLSMPLLLQAWGQVEIDFIVDYILELKGLLPVYAD